MTPPTTNRVDAIRKLLDDGMSVEDVKVIENNFRLKHPEEYFGSVFTELELDKFITQDEEMIKLKESVRKLAPLPDPVIIYGETGTGKEILARAMHGSRTGNFRAINCAAIPDLLLESILFGHKKGSFTGAVADNPGLMRSCWNGTLFLDEIGELPMTMQAKLLRALQEKKVLGVGELEEKEINCRFVFATNQKLRQLITEKLFRPDLYHRLSVFELKTKPLSDRKPDIMLIAKSLWEEIPEDKLKALPDNFDECYLDGNVRELQNIIRRMQVGIV